MLFGLFAKKFVILKMDAIAAAAVMNAERLALREKVNKYIKRLLLGDSSNNLLFCLKID